MKEGKDQVSSNGKGICEKEHYGKRAHLNSSAFSTEPVIPKDAFMLCLENSNGLKNIVQE